MLNLTALEHYLATQLHTIVRVYDKSRTLQSQYSKRIDLVDELFEGRVENHILSSVSPDAPAVVTVNVLAAYGAVDAGERIYVVGPVCVTGAMGLRHALTGVPYGDGFVNRLSPCSVADLVNALLLIHNLYHPGILTLQKCLEANDLSERIGLDANQASSVLLFDNRENSSHHNPYDHEQRELLSIETGDLALLRRCWDEDYSGSFGTISRDAVRNGKYLAVIVVTMATRAAIRGGILPEVAMSLGDVYMRQIDETQNPYDIGTITRNAQYSLAELVAQRRSAGERGPECDPVVKRCKEYISRHLHEKITVRDVAGRLRMHPNYLSSTFKRHEGVSLYQFILGEKTALAKNLLIYSDYSFSEIASYLGFSSQSHLGKVFKSSTGQTLQEFRHKFRRVEDQT